MLEVLFVLAVLALIAGGVAFAVALAKKGQDRYDAQNALVPGMASDAPAEWAGSHSDEAKLHRRLIAVMQDLHAMSRVGEEDVAGLELRVELEQHALAVDRRLVRVASMPAAARGPELAEIEVSVAAIEEAAEDLSRRIAQDGASADVMGLEDLSARIKGMTAEG